MRFSLSTVALAVLSSTVALVAGAAVSNDPRKGNLAGADAAVSTATVRQADITSDVAKGTFKANRAPAATDVLYICDPFDFLQPCYFLSITNLGGCFTVPTLMDNKISSIQGLQPNLRCFLFTGYGCTGNSGYIDRTGAISRLPAPFDNNISSIACLALTA